ncbi:MAG: hypothetical protein ACI8PB_003523 [Desulforhopalus sp.]|jgi:hypothetical protein
MLTTTFTILPLNKRKNYLMKNALGSIVTVSTLFIGSNVLAMDIGAMQLAGSTFSAELIHESYERDVKNTYTDPDEQYTGVQDEQRTFIRLRYSPQPKWGLTLDAGATDSDESEGYAPLIGLGAHVNVYQHNGFYASLFAKATYTFNIEYKWTSYYSGENWNATSTSTQTEDLLEYSGGIQLGKEWIPCSGTRITGYTGVMASFIESSEDVIRNYNYSDEKGMRSGTNREKDFFDIEEDQPIMFLAGVETTFTKYEIGIRAETRFYGRPSFSVGLFKNF